MIWIIFTGLFFLNLCIYNCGVYKWISAKLNTPKEQEPSRVLLFYTDEVLKQRFISVDQNLDFLRDRCIELEHMIGKLGTIPEMRGDIDKLKMALGFKEFKSKSLGG